MLVFGTEDEVEEDDDIGRCPGERGKGGVPSFEFGVPGGDEDALLFHDGRLNGHSDPI